MFERHLRHFFKAGAESDLVNPALSEESENPADETIDSENAGMQPEAKETRAESAETIKELVDWWAEEYETTTDEAKKRELAYKIVKMESALGLANLTADKVKIKEDEEGTLGLYDPETGELAMTWDGLNLPPEHFADVLVHEAAHSGDLTGHRIMDEGMAEWKTVHGLPGAMQGIYVKERRLATEAFDPANMAEAVKKYDYDAPAKLAKFYLEIELEYLWRDKLKAEFLADQKGKKPLDEEKLLAKLAAKADKESEAVLKKGTPDLYAKLKALNFDFKGIGVEILGKLAKQEQ
ncbi:MAG: hypothetical protein WCW26_02115 [Candidatus Buchananbacteria bacterium]